MDHPSSPRFRAAAALTQQGSEGLGVLGGENAQNLVSCPCCVLKRKGRQGEEATQESGVLGCGAGCPAE